MLKDALESSSQATDKQLYIENLGSSSQELINNFTSKTRSVALANCHTLIFKHWFHSFIVVLLSKRKSCLHESKLLKLCVTLTREIINLTNQKLLAINHRAWESLRISQNYTKLISLRLNLLV